MNIELKHPFVNKCPDVDGWLKKDDGTIVNSIEAFCHRTISQSAIHGKSFGLTDSDGANKFKGDAFETLVEFMIRLQGSDNRIGIFDYQLPSENDEEDNGVDGHGIGANQNPATVQVKFRTGNYVLTANEDHLSNFMTSSIYDYHVSIDDTKNMLIITTGLKVDERTMEKMLKNRVRVLNRDALREMFDNRPEFWNAFYDAVKHSRVEVKVLTPIPLRNHQAEAVDAILKDINHKGMIILPTGTGKTIIEAEVVRQEIVKSLSMGNKSPVIKVNSSRILLCFQLFEEVFNYLNSYGIQARYINFNSGNADEKYYAIALRKAGGIFREITSTTSAKGAKEAYSKAQKEDLPLIVFSTYHSSENFAGSGIVPDLTIHDEAHNLVSPEFNKVAMLPSKSSYFFTATMKVTDSDLDRGMNNKSVFDEIIYQKSAKAMIEVGEMVQPRIHIVKAKGSKIDIDKTDADYSAMFNSVISAFRFHSDQIKKDSYDATKIGAKVLVVCRGQQDLIQMFETQTFKDFVQNNPKIHIFALSSEFGLRSNGEYFKPPVTNMKKYKILKHLKAMGADEECIVFHVDMIGEGIDVPGITGVMPFRNCEMSKFIQNIGRAARLHKEDRIKFYKGEINPSDLTKYIKPYSWIIIPTFLVDSVGFADRFKGIIQKLRDEYGISKENVLMTNDRGMSDDAIIDKDNDMDKVKRHSKSGIDGFDHDAEELSCIEKIIFEEEISAKKNDIMDKFRKLDEIKA